MGTAVPVFHDIEIQRYHPGHSPNTMSDLPDDIFRRKAPGARLRRLEKCFKALDEALAIDYAAAAEAVRYHLASVMMEQVGRPDLEAHFDQLAQAAIIKARSARKVVMRDFSGRREYDRNVKKAKQTLRDRAQAKDKKRQNDDQPYKKKD
jgi:hypothetical protein